MELDLKNKTVLITGGSKGIGRATAELFIKEGCKVAICSRSQANLISAVAEIKKSYNIEPLWIVCDLTKDSDIENAVNVVKKNFGPIDILVNNVGGPVPGKFTDLNDDDWFYAFEQLLMSTVRMIKRVLPDMKGKKWGRIINITSLSVKQPVDNLILSNSIRSAITAMTKTLSNEIGSFNITVNNVAPGYTLTGRLYELAVNKAKETGESHEHILANMSAEVPLKRLARPDEIGSLIVYLSSEQASFITGTTILIDGGVVKSIS
ncbi:MAG: 3-oxoacyl-ACP reductase [Ignavibacteriales bacterium CG_4_9_14_3_um_filter_34_10]|nr:MAG: 3-oxoacyl-ACP reductase [Ignavibacteriales bacterium CG_4_9_14_3_um_filter_34_10]